MKPTEMLGATINSGIAKANTGFTKLIILGILAGAFIGFAAQGSNMAAFNLLLKPETFGLGKALAGAIFGTGLMLVIIGGGELFTGNVLMLTSLADKRIKVWSMLRNWIIVYVSNFVGSIIIVLLIYYSNQLSGGENMLGALTLKVAANKIHLTFISAVCLGILCNWLVCMAVWMACGTKSSAGKILCIFFPIWLFITSGFEHSVANMYYIPIGILAKSNEAIVRASELPAQMIDSLTWSSFLFKNLLPVTIGNVIGGGVFVAMAYFLAFKQQAVKKYLAELENQ